MWEIMYLYVRNIDLVSYCDFDIWYWNCSDDSVVLMFFFHFILSMQNGRQQYLLTTNYADIFRMCTVMMTPFSMVSIMARPYSQPIASGVIRGICFNTAIKISFTSRTTDFVNPNLSRSWTKIRTVMYNGMSENIVL